MPEPDEGGAQGASQIPDGPASAGATSAGASGDGVGDGENAEVVKLKQQIAGLEKIRDQAHSERDKAKQDAEHVRNDLIEKLAAQAAPVEKATDWATERKRIIDELDAAENSGAVVDLMLEAMKDAEEGGFKRSAAEIAKLQAKIDAISATQQEQDPEWVANREKIKRLGLAEKLSTTDRKTLISVAKLVPDGPEQPARSDMVGSTGTVVGRTEAPVSVPSDMLATIETAVGPLTAAEKKMLADKHRRAANATA